MTARHNKSDGKLLFVRSKLTISTYKYLFLPKVPNNDGDQFQHLVAQMAGPGNFHRYVVDHIDVLNEWPRFVSSRIILQNAVNRSDSQQAVFLQQGAHRSNTEALTEIYAMARCDYLLHGHSAMTEAVLDIHPEMNNGRSVNFEDPDHMSVEELERIVVQDFGT